MHRGVGGCLGGSEELIQMGTVFQNEQEFIEMVTRRGVSSGSVNSRCTGSANMKQYGTAE